MLWHKKQPLCYTNTSNSHYFTCFIYSFLICIYRYGSTPNPRSWNLYNSCFFCSKSSDFNFYFNESDYRSQLFTLRMRNTIWFLWITCETSSTFYSTYKRRVFPGRRRRRDQRLRRRDTRDVAPTGFGRCSQQLRTAFARGVLVASAVRRLAIRQLDDGLDVLRSFRRPRHPRRTVETRRRTSPANQSRSELKSQIGKLWPRECGFDFGVLGLKCNVLGWVGTGWVRVEYEVSTRWVRGEYEVTSIYSTENAESLSVVCNCDLWTLGYTACDFAIYFGHSACVKMLENPPPVNKAVIQM